MNPQDCLTETIGPDLGERTLASRKLRVSEILGDAESDSRKRLPLRKENMDTKERIKEILTKLKPTLKEKFKVKEIGIFGSCARGKESEDSDVDILVEFSGPVGWEFIDVREFLEEILGRKVDLVTVRALKPQLRDKILKEVVFA
jgi:predicted nucleotidyltransferase